MGPEDTLGAMMPPEQTAMAYQPEPEINISKLNKYIESDNVADMVDKDRLEKIGQRCYEGFEVDDKSREDWLEQVESAMELATQATKEKNFPWEGAANIKLPVIQDACIKFAARAYSEIVKDGKVVKAKVVGEDPDGSKAERATRVGDYMSWQLTEKEKEWDTDTDRLLHILPLVGHLFRKRYWCPSHNRTKSELCMPKDVCVNAETSSLETCRRITHIIRNVPKNTIVGNQRAGVFRKMEFQTESGNDPDDMRDCLNSQDFYTLLEQCCWLDLDEDGLEEPYVVTIEKESRQVLRITAAYDDDGVHENDDGEIMAVDQKLYYTDYVFIPSLDGSYYGTGFGQMLEPLTRVANTLVNQLADGGALNNIQGGYLSREVEIKGGSKTFQLGEWKRTTATSEQLRNGVFPLPTKEPSPTLFNLLGLIMDLTQDLASVKDVMNGDAPGNNVPATTVVALIEQGMKTFNAIYKRIYRSLTREFQQLYGINYDYMDETEYFEVLDSQGSVDREDFEAKTFNISPVADPVLSSDMQRLARAEALSSMIGMPGVNPRPIIKLRLDALKVPESQQAEILPEQDPNALPPESQKLIQDAESKMADIQIKEQELDLKERELEIKAHEAYSKVIKNLADAEGVEAGTQLSQYQQFSNELLKVVEMERKAEEARIKQNEQAQPQNNA